METHARGCTLKPFNARGENIISRADWVQLLARWVVGVRVPVTAPGLGCGARTGAGTPGTLGLSVNDGKRPWEATSSNSLQNGGEWPSEATLPSVKDLLPFRFRYAAVQNNGTRQTALGSNILKYFATWRRMALGSKIALRERFASVPFPLCRSPIQRQCGKKTCHHPYPCCCPDELNRAAM